MSVVVCYVIRDCGDGSQYVEWYNNITKELLVDLCEQCGDERYQSGDGIQVTEVRFPDGFDVTQIQGISWSCVEDLIES